MTKKYLKLKDACDYLSVGERTLRRLVATKKITYTKIGDGQNRHLRFKIDWLEDWIDKQKITPITNTEVSSNSNAKSLMNS